jgi:cytochrome b6-f complex iron-sulfur subunit
MQQHLDMYDRREFCKRLGSAAACGGGLTLLSGCGGNPMSAIPGSPLPNVSATVANGIVTISISSSSPLGSTGGMALVSSTAGTFLVTRTGATSFVAVTAQCTHEACVVSNATPSSYVCPCHGSEFDTSGRVLVGPATAPLRQFQTEFSNNVLMIS